MILNGEFTYSKAPVKHAKRQISTQVLRDAEIIGDLGVPIGTLVTIEGRYKDMTFTKNKADDGRFVMVIEKVDGQLVPKHVEFEAGSGSRFDLIRPTDKQEFELIGYEIGHFWVMSTALQSTRCLWQKGRSPLDTMQVSQF
jgi:hypothetical protein